MANRATTNLSGVGRQSPGPRQITARKRLIVVAIAACFTSAPAWSNPTAPQVVNGSASFNQAGKLLTVNNSNGAIINWNSFSIGAGETTRFNQASAASSVLNRVIANDPSVLLGTLSSNGRVWLVNPAGIMVGQGARIDVAGFIASTLNVRNEDFLAGRLNFGATPNAGKIENHGQISTPSGGSVYLVAPAVENHGIINAPNGEVILAAGQTAQLIDTGTPGVKVDITGAEGNVTNLGEIVAEAGRIGMASVLVKNSGTMNASSVVKEGGRIFLKATKTIELADSSIISADGTNGGRIIAKTAVNGQISGELVARGELSAQGNGAMSKGGFIETSAARVKIADDVRVTTAAPMGLAGTWLIDPVDFTIAAGGGGVTTSGIGASTLSTSLGSGNVNIATDATTAGNGDIFVNDVVSWSANKLTLTAHRNIDINSSLNGSGGASLALEYGQGAVAAGNTSSYKLASGTQVNLPAGLNFSTKLGNDVAATNYTVITSLGAAADATTTPGILTLQGMAATVNLAAKYVLGSNIDATPTSAWNAGAGFTPIGNTATQFTGTFDGLGHTISNLAINRPTADYVGLFGYTYTGAAIRNVGLVGDSVSGNSYVGGLVGYNYYGAVSNGNASGSVTGNNYVGGLAGQNYRGTIDTANASGSVIGSDYVGGLVGYNYNNGYGAVNNSSATGSVAGNYSVGGLVGRNYYGTISDSSASVSVTGSDNVGGLVGYNDYYSTVSNSNASVSVTGNSYVGGLVGYNYYATVSNSSASGSVTGNQYVGGLAGQDYLSTIDTASASGSVTGNYSVGGLVGYKYSGTVSNSTASGSVTGNDNVGGLVGRNYSSTVSNSSASGSVTGNSYVGGLVGYNYYYGTVSNSNASGNVTGNDHVGGLVGYNYNYGTVSDSNASGSVTGGDYIGGLVGENSGTINNSYATGNVTGTNYLGGLVGQNNGTLNSSHYDIDSVLINGGSHVTEGGLYAGQYAAWFPTKTLDIDDYATSLPLVGGYYTISGTQGLKDLLGFADQGYAFQLTNDLVAPLGWHIPVFIGQFDGGTKTISNLSVNQPFNSNIGFIGRLKDYGTVTDLGLINVSVTGNNNVGGLVGYNDSGTVSNISASGSVTGNDNVGGLMGYNYGNINNANASVSVTGNDNVGGLVGYNYYGTVSNSNASGSVTGSNKVGGLVGYSSGTIDNAYATGVVAKTVTGGDYFGGLVGYNDGTISNSYATGNVTGTNYLGGLVGQNNGTLSNSHYDIDSVLINGGSHVTEGGIYAGQYAAWFPTKTLDIADYNSTSLPLVGSDYTISNAQGLKDLLGFADQNYAFLLTSDLVAPPGWHIPFFTGQFDGGGNTISNLSVNQPFNSNIGFIGRLKDYGTVTGLGLINVSVTGKNNVGGLVGYNNNYYYGYVSNSTASGSVTGNDYVGGLVGYNYYGTVNNSSASVSVTGNDNVGGLVGFSYGGSVNASGASGSVTGNSYVGGLVGYNSWSNGVVDSFASGIVTGNYSVGGLVGFNYGTISNANASGSVTGSNNVGGLVGSNNSGTIDNAYATGVVIGSDYVGGLVGYNDANIYNSYATGNVTGTNYLGGLVGQNNGTLSNSHYDIDSVLINNGSYVTEGGIYAGQYAAWFPTKTLDIEDYNSTSLPLVGSFYTISDAQGLKDLLGFADQGYAFQLTSDLVAPPGWHIPVFDGQIDGGTKTISNLSVNQPFNSNIGFIGRLKNYGTVTDLVLTNVSVTGKNNVGGLVGYNDSNYYGTVSDNSVSGSVTGNDAVGGLVGYNYYGTVSNSSSSASVTGNVAVGGLMGYNYYYGTVSNSSATGSVTGSNNVGGLVGHNSGTINNAYATCVVDKTVTGGDSFGGLVGFNTGTVSNSYATGNVTGTNYLGGLVGQNNGTLSNSHYDIDSVLINGGSHVTEGGLYSGQYQDWQDGARALLSVGNYFSPPDEGGYYSIGSGAQGLLDLKNLLGFADQSGFRFRLTNNLDLTSQPGWHIPVFAGYEFNGGGNTISNLSVNQPFNSNIGFIGRVKGYGTVTGLGLTNVSVTGKNNVGGLVGNKQGYVSYSYATGTVTGDDYVGGLVGYNNYGDVSNSHATANVTGNDYVGGLVGYRYGYGNIENAYATGSVTGNNYVGGLVGNDGGEGSGLSSNAYASGNVMGNNYVGGLVGYHNGTIENAYATGSVTGNAYVGGLVGQNGGDGGEGGQSLTNSYAVGSVIGNSNVGGLVGSSDMDFAFIINSYWDKNTSGQTSSSGGIGKTSAEMRQSGTFNGWRIANSGGSSADWRIYEGRTTPLLRSFLTPLTVTADNVTKTFDGSIVTSLVNASYSVIGAAGSGYIPNIANPYNGAINTGSYVPGLYSTQLGYDISHVNGLLTINPAGVSTTTSINLSGTRAYDGTVNVAAGIFTLGGLVSGQDLTLTGVGTVADKNVGVNKPVNLGTLTLGNGTTGLASNYTFTGGTQLATITPAPLTVGGLTAQNKVYDTTTVATLSGGLLAGVIAGDTVSLANPTGSFNDKNVGAAKPVSVSELTLAGADAGNYSVTPPTGATLIADITPASLTLSGLSAQNKVYDTTTVATITGTAAFSGVLGSDVVTLGGSGSVSGSFADKNVGVAKPVSVTGLSLSGTDAGNYTLTSAATTSADITPASLTLSGLTAQNKVYDATTVATISGTVAFSGVLGTDVVTLGGDASASFADKHVGVAKPVSVTGLTLAGVDAGNYMLTSTSASTSADIIPASLTLSGLTAQNKVYDATTVATIAGTATFSGVLGADIVTLDGNANGSFADKNVGVAKPVSVTGLTLSGTDAGNYTINATAATSADITARALNVTATGVAKVYDGQTGAIVAFGDNRVAGDVLAPSGSASYLDKNVGSGKSVSVSGITLTGADAGNYTLSGTTATTTADITVRPLSTWIGGASGNWSSASNWDALPDLSNVLAVSAPTGNVIYDAAAGSTNLTSLTAAGLNIAGGNLNIANNLTLSSSFSQSGGALGFGGGASANITQASGSLNVPALTLANLSLAAPAGAITQSGAIVAAALNTQSQTGTTLNNPGNRIASFGAVNSGNGNVSLINTSPLTITGISNTVGSIAIDNTGAVTTVGPVTASSGPVTIVGHSPLTIGAGGVSASGNVVLTAGNTAGSGDNLTLSGPVGSTGSGGSVALTAGDNLLQNANVTTSGGAVTAAAQTGNISMDLGSTTSSGGGSIGYAASSGNVVLTSLNAGSGAIALNAGGGIQTAPGFTGANLIGGNAVIVAGANANLSTQVNQLNVTAGGNYSITNALTGTVTTKATASGSVAPALNQVVSTVVATTQQQPAQATSQTTTPPPAAPPPTTSGGSGPLLLSNTNQTIGGGEGTFGGSSSSGADKTDKPVAAKAGDDKLASAKKDDAKADDKKDEKKDDDKKKDDEPAAKKDEGKPAAKKLAICS